MPKEVRETKAIVLVRDKAKQVVAHALGMTIASQGDAEFATETLSFISASKKNLEDQRTFLVGPLNAHVKDINAKFKEWAAPLVEADVVLRKKVLAYHQEVARLAEAEREVEVVLGVPEKDLVPLPAKLVNTPTGSTTVRKTWTYEVEDYALIPKAYLMIDDQVINLAIKDGTRKIKGLKIYQKESLAVR